MTDRSQRALLLHGHNLSSNDRNLAALLDFFGVPWSSVTLDEVARDRALPSNLVKGKSCILSSASQMTIALQGVEAVAAHSIRPAEWIIVDDSDRFHH